MKTAGNPLLVLLLVTIAATPLLASPLQAADTAPSLVRTIDLPGVTGRIDHMDIDLVHSRLLLSALGNGTLEIIDIRTGKVVHEISDLQEPQGSTYLSRENRILVACGGDGKAYVYDAASWKFIDAIDLGSDADDTFYDAAADRVFIGHGDGAFAVIDAKSDKIQADIPLDGHPERFALDAAANKVFVNVPNADEIEVVDLTAQSVVQRWPMGDLHANFPMTLDAPNHRLFVVCRRPSRLLVMNELTGRIIANLACVGDADDMYYDVQRRCIYISGGAGMLDVFSQNSADDYALSAAVRTSPGARTSLYVPTMNMIFIAARQTAGTNAAILEYQLGR